MNHKRRKELLMALQYMNSALTIISRTLDQEEDSFDNIPESLQETDNYITSEMAINRLEDAIDQLEESIDNVHDAIYGE